MSEPLSDEEIAEIETRLREFTGWYGPNAQTTMPRLLATIAARDERIVLLEAALRETLPFVEWFAGEAWVKPDPDTEALVARIAALLSPYQRVPAFGSKGGETQEWFCGRCDFSVKDKNEVRLHHSIDLHVAEFHGALSERPEP